MDASIPTRRPGSRLATGLIWIYQTIAFYFVLAAYGIVFLGWNLPATLFYWVLPRSVSARFGQLAIMSGFRMMLGLMRVTGLAYFDLSAIDTLRDEPGLVIAPNHPTLLDALLVTSRLPRVVCITKASLWDNPALGAGARLAGYIRNDAPHRLVRRAASAVRGGSQLLIFPEGTRTVTPPLGSFKAGFALMARQAGAPVQTVFLEASSPYLSKGWPLVRRPAFPLHYRARLGRRFTVDGPAERFCNTLEAYMRTELGRP
jgi:1-acyl-sn-glycerol-3-phosphate acyltransferase